MEIPIFQEAEIFTLTRDSLPIESTRRWLKNAEIVDILQDQEKYGLEQSLSAANMPESGSLYLFNKRDVRNWRRDGHNWKKKKDGKNVMEHHEKLKVKGIEMLNCCYAHHEHFDGFHRRCYWLLVAPMVVLVHYRQQEQRDMSSSSASLADLHLIRCMAETSSAIAIPPAIQPMDRSQVVLAKIPFFSQSESMEQVLNTPAPFRIATRSTSASITTGNYSKAAYHVRSQRQIPYSSASIASDSNSLSSNKSRRERKASLAKMSRERKKAKVRELEKQVGRLTLQLEQLTANNPPAVVIHSSNDPQPREHYEATMESAIRNLNKTLTRHDVRDVDFQADLDTCFAAINGQANAAVIHVNKAKQAATPGSQAMFALWGLEQLPEIPFSGTVASPFRAEGKGLWTSLLEGELGVDPAQARALHQRQASAHQLRTEQRRIDDEFDALQRSVQATSLHVQQLFMQIRRIFEPEQMARFLCWLDRRYQ